MSQSVGTAASTAGIGTSEDEKYPKKSSRSSPAISAESGFGEEIAAKAEASKKKEVMDDLKRRQKEWETNASMLKQLKGLKNPSDGEKTKREELEKWFLMNNKPTYAGTRRHKRKSKKASRRRRHTRRR
jgi:hypothetical protein